MNSPTELERVLELGPHAPRRGWLRFTLLLTTLIAVATFALVRYTPENLGPRFKTATAARGNLTVLVTATGALQPRTQVDVGTEVSGTVAEVLADYNGQVQAGQTLARLDTTKLEAQAAQSRASLALNEARLQDAQAALQEARNTLTRYREMRKQSQNSLPSEQDLDAADAKFKRAQASEAIAHAQIAEARAKLQLDETNLAKAVIRAPISGVVLARLVEPGQTVAASLQAPVLFRLAEDLARMELQVDVDEADVGQTQAGQEATFSVDAYPDRKFQARVTQVRYAPQSVNNVVTYKALLAVDNADLALRPGMTATADIMVRQIEHALLVPNAALRFIPPTTTAKVEQRDFLSMLLSRRPPNRPNRADSAAKNNAQRVWVLGGDGQPKEIAVKLGASDGRMSEIISGELTEGAQILLETLKNPS